jgi:imidazolonepropionase-like amidohydrolase
MADILLRNLSILDTVAGTLLSGWEVLISGKKITAVEHGAINAPGAETIDLGGRTLMPGLIDCHVHMAPGAMLVQPMLMPSFVTARASSWLRQMLLRGFTTVRDAGGADAGLRQAIEAGHFLGPRLFVSGRAISQTGGHGDKRWPAEMDIACCCSATMGGIGRVADGVDAVRHAVRDELRRGANQIKVMAGGGVSSPADALGHLQYSLEELRAMSDEAARQNTYCLAHVYTSPGIARAVECGIRTIEHGNFLDEPTAAIMARHGAYLVPTLVTYRADAENGKSVGFTEEALVKNAEVLEAGTRSLEIAARAGVKIAYGTDLAYSPKTNQPREFLVRAEAQAPADIIRSATVIGAEVVGLAGRAGVVAPGAFADLLVLDGNPLDDLGLFQSEGKHMAAIMKEGVFVKNRISA